MSSPEPIVCKPTAWFRYRAGIIFLMFAVFGVLFYIDGSTGYRKKNKLFYLHQCFKKASHDFSELNADQQLDPAGWSRHVSEQTVVFPDDHSILPADLELPMPWPEVLGDFERMKSLQWNQLWLDYTAERGLDSKPPEKVYDARTIREQWVFFYICTSLAGLSLFFLIRTSRRSIVATGDALIAQDGRSVPYSDFNRLDLRKWDNKGIAIAEYDGSCGKGKIRIDGLTYGGFKKEAGSPAEMLMKRLREHFSGEIIEYTAIDEVGNSDAQNQEDESEPK